MHLIVYPIPTFGTRVDCFLSLRLIRSLLICLFPGTSVARIASCLGLELPSLARNQQSLFGDLDPFMKSS